MLACLALTSMCVTALLLGRRPNETQGRVIAGFVAAACMLPCRLLLPNLYKSANAPLKAPVVRSWPNLPRRVRAGRCLGAVHNVTGAAMRDFEVV